jgi:hydrogenase maturation protein HypF
MAENGRSAPVIGISCDGTGYGDDGANWGCEILLTDLRGYDRLGHLRYMPLIGGDAAASETWRPALAILHDVFGNDCVGMAKNCGIDVPEQRLKTALEMLEVNANCPRSSSLGRWFDAVAALTRLATENQHEGQAPMLLEAAITRGLTEEYPYQIACNHPFLIDLRPAVAKLVQDITSGTPVGVLSAKFHNTVASFLAASAVRARELTSVNVVALSGGCFANRYLSSALTERLESSGFQVLVHHIIPTNDGGIALGQAVVAAARTHGKNLISSFEIGGQKET